METIEDDQSSDILENPDVQDSLLKKEKINNGVSNGINFKWKDIQVDIKTARPSTCLRKRRRCGDDIESNPDTVSILKVSFL